MRKTKEELDLIMKQENVSRLFSWSRLNTFLTSKYEYLLKYVKHTPEDRNDSIYASCGGSVHDILEKYYTGQIQYEDMSELFEDAWLTMYDIAQLKFDRNDEEKNKKIADKYYLNLKHFFANHETIKYKPIIEQFVKVRIGSNVFFGYLDCVFKDDEGNYHIIDFKTSSLYRGEKALKESGQLVLYSIALNQMGISLEKIRIAWNFLKYCNIEYEQANGIVKSKQVDRSEIGSSLQSNAKMWLKKLGYESETDYYLKLLLDTNDITCLPEEVREKYDISDCYVYVNLTDDLIKHWTDLITTTIVDICMREHDYETTGSDKAFWDSEQDVEKQSYYFSNLCGYSANLHKPYAEYLQKLEASKNNDFFSGVGSGLNNMATTSAKIDNSLAWLDEL